ncbi:Meiosis-specific protein mei4 [Porites harrisoni]
MSVFNSFMEDVYLHQYVKIALAVAIIKRKPKDVTTKSYIEDLLKILQIQDGNRNRKVVELDKRLLEGQRDLMSIVLSKPELELAPFHHEGCENPMLFLEDSSVLKSTLLGALEFLTMATLQSKETLPVPKQMYQACINKLEGLSSIVDDYSKIKSRVEQMVDSLLHYFLQLRSSSPVGKFLHLFKVAQ